MKLTNVGYGNMVATQRIVAVVAPDSAPVRRLIQETREAGRIIDATAGRKTRAVLVLDSGHAVLSPLQPETLTGRSLERPERPAQKETEGMRADND